MRVINPSVEILSPLNKNEIYRIIENAGRICYKSEDKIGNDSTEKFIRNVIKRGHESVIEHVSITVKFVTDRGISHEIVRHRLASYSQESTRYCNYGNNRFGNEITVIKPLEIEDDSIEYWIWEKAMQKAEKIYFQLL